SEIRRREENVVSNIIRNADVVLTTAAGAATHVLRRALSSSGTVTRRGEGPVSAMGGGGGFRGFDVVVIDEVAQALEVACFPALLQGAKCVVAGDHCQLPPTITSREAAAGGLIFTLANRIVSRFGDDRGSDLGIPLDAGSDSSIPASGAPKPSALE